MKIVVLAGGLSPERDVSLSSGCLIANALMESNHSVILLDLYKGLDIELLESKTLFKNEHDNIKYHHLVNESEPDLNKLKEDTNNEDNLIGINVINICKKADIIFMALHGSSGENGQIQALFDVLGIKYTGTGYVGSLLAMDKDITKKLLLTSNILTPKWFTINNNEELEKAINKISLPCIMKPIDNGSSIGVSIIENLSDAKKKFLETKKSNSKIMIEEKISGREFSVGILENQALPIIEIIPNKGFYDYKNKYQSGFTKEICPAFIPGSVFASKQ